MTATSDERLSPEPHSPAPLASIQYSIRSAGAGCGGGGTAALFGDASHPAALYPLASGVADCTPLERGTAAPGRSHMSPSGGTTPRLGDTRLGDSRLGDTRLGGGLPSPALHDWKGAHSAAQQLNQQLSTRRSDAAAPQVAWRARWRARCSLRVV